MLRLAPQGFLRFSQASRNDTNWWRTSFRNL